MVVDEQRYVAFMRLRRGAHGSLLRRSRYATGSALRSPRSRPAADPRGYAPASPEQTTSAVVFPNFGA